MRYISAENCLTKVNNRFDLVILAAQRANQLDAGYASVIEDCGHKSTIQALQEISADQVTLDNITAIDERGLAEDLLDDELISLANETGLQIDKLSISDAPQAAERTEIQLEKTAVTE